MFIARTVQNCRIPAATPISFWNTVYLQKAYDYCKNSDPEITNYLEYTSPIIWRHINLLGEYKIDLTTLPEELRELNQGK